jgi:hypothetical protein
MTGSVCCCARAANGSIAAEPAITLMKSRRLIVAPDTQGAAWPPFAVQYKKIINTDWSIRNANTRSLSLHDVRFSRHASGPWRNSKRSGLIKKRLRLRSGVKVKKKSAFYFEIYGSSFAAENKGHWRWAIFCGHEKKPVQVGSFHGPLAAATEHAKAAVSRLKERAKKGAPLHIN